MYSDLAIETGLALPLVLHLGLRQTLGALGSIADFLDVDVRIPDHTTFSRRGDGLTMLTNPVGRGEPLHLLIDSPGLKMYGEGEWLHEKRGGRSRRRWRKLPLAVDTTTQAIAARELTPDDVGDITALPDLLDRIADTVGSVTADGAYDGDTVYHAVLQRHPDADAIVPPASTAVVSGTSRRDEPLETIEKHGRIGWQRRSGYGRRSLVETATYRYKTLIGRRLHAWTLSNQQTEAKIGCSVINRMTRLGMPVSVRVR